MEHYKERRSYPSSRSWNLLFGGMVELMQVESTRYDTGRQMEARLDKVYTTLPAWALLQLSAKSWLDLSAQTTKQRSPSDHAMLRWHFVKKSDKGKQFRP
eukprot:6418259-Karenia_brevis.AAC.1